MFNMCVIIPTSSEFQEQAGGKKSIYIVSEESVRLEVTSVLFK